MLILIDSDLKETRKRVKLENEFYPQLLISSFDRFDFVHSCAFRALEK